MIRMAKNKPDVPEMDIAGAMATEDLSRGGGEGDPQASVAPPVRLVYVGPNIPGGILQRFQVFKGGLPPHARELFDKVSEVRELFVPVTELEDARRKIEEPGTNEARLFYAVQQATAKGVK